MATLLIVDDDTNIREVLQELFSHKHECHTADRAEQALAYLELETYDVVITDIAMPGLGGEGILKWVQKKIPATPVIVISGVADREMAKKLIEMGAFAYFTKPYELDDLEEAVARAIDRHQEMPGTASVQHDAQIDRSNQSSDS
jgi:DNA-binding NtrC family response regulator